MAWPSNAYYYHILVILPLTVLNLHNEYAAGYFNIVFFSKDIIRGD